MQKEAADETRKSDIDLIEDEKKATSGREEESDIRDLGQLRQPELPPKDQSGTGGLEKLPKPRQNVHQQLDTYSMINRTDAKTTPT